MILAAFLQFSTSQALPIDTWAQLSSAETRFDYSVTVDFIVPNEAARQRGEYTLRMIRSRNAVVEILWANSLKCSAVRDAVSAIRSVPTPEPQLPGEGTGSVRDGTLYKVTYHARYGDDDAGVVELSSNIGTPLANWVNRIIVRLSDCWSPVQPPTMTR